MKRLFSWRRFRYAWHGIQLTYKSEPNFRIQLGCALCVVLAMLVIPMQSWERTTLLVVTMLVLVLELINSSIERLVDLAKPRLDVSAGGIKDIMAGAVLLASCVAVCIGFFIFWPYVSSLIRPIL